MIQSFNKDENEIECSIVPKLKSFNELCLTIGDTLVIYWDFEKYCLDEAQEFFKILEKGFPNNQVIFIPKGSEIGVIKNEQRI